MRFTCLQKGSSRCFSLQYQLQPISDYCGFMVLSPSYQGSCRTWGRIDEFIIQCSLTIAKDKITCKLAISEWIMQQSIPLAIARMYYYKYIFVIRVTCNYCGLKLFVFEGERWTNLQWNRKALIWRFILFQPGPAPASGASQDNQHDDLAS